MKLTTILILIICSISIGLSESANPSRSFAQSTLSAAPYPCSLTLRLLIFLGEDLAAWAHSHMVWIDRGRSNQTLVMEFAKSFLDHNIPVGGIDIDSQWATGDNTFVWDTSKFPNAKQMIDWFHSNGIRVVLWATSVLNVDTPLYNYAKKQNYFLNDGATQKWWHGVGSWIDYTNDDAVDWWHKQMDLVLDQGVDGFKNDGTDPYVFLFLPYAYGKKGVVSEREYAEAYYRDFLFYSRTKNPQAITWARPCDSYGTPDCIKFAPKDVMFSGWVGDQRGTFEGMQGALYNYLRSAWDGYLNYGSDIGGYLNDNGNPLGRTKEVFIRWAQLGAFSPLMENGGNGEHRPWMFDTTGETVDIYRTFVHYHVELTPYFISTATEKFSQGKSVMSPLAEKTVFHPSTYDYKLGEDILVCPVTKANTTSRSVTFPSGDNWVDWYAPKKIYSGGSKVQYDTSSLAIFPVFQRQGSILPLNVTSSYTNHGSEFSAGALTLLVGQISDTNRGSTVIRGEYPDGISQEISYEYNPATGMFELMGTSHPDRELIVLLRGVVQCSPETQIVIKDELTGSYISRIPELRTKSANMKLLAEKGVGYIVGQHDITVRVGSKSGVHISVQCIKNVV